MIRFGVRVFLGFLIAAISLAVAVAATTAGASVQRHARILCGTERWTVKTRAAVTGVAFFDYDHGQTGVAPNAIELHPVLAFRCLSP
jgi:hypothetical protein